MLTCVCLPGAFAILKSKLSSVMQAQQSVFGEYRVESMQQNRVFIETPANLLIKSLRHGTTASNTLMKLTRKHGTPSLSCIVSVSATTKETV